MSEKLQANIAAIGLTHGSPSQYEKPICLRLFEYVYLKDERKNIPTNVPAIAGGAAHDAIQGIMCDGLAPEGAIQVAQKRISEHTPTDDNDEIKRDRYVEDVEAMVVNGTEGCLSLTSGWFNEAMTAEEQITVEHPKLTMPIIGFVDLIGDFEFIEIKTKWNGLGMERKDGSRGVRKVKLPEVPQPEHVRQVAVYSAATGKKANLVYATTEGYVTFNSDNCGLLSDASLNHHFNQILHNAIVWENLLSISSDPNVLKYWIQPNWGDFRWRFMPDDYLQQAKELFKI